MRQCIQHKWGMGTDKSTTYRGSEETQLSRQKQKNEWEEVEFTAEPNVLAISAGAQCGPAGCGGTCSGAGKDEKLYVRM